jgi:hypothetical protein
MAERTTTSISVSKGVRDRFTTYQKALARAHGVSGTADELIAAMIDGVPQWQAAIMLRTYQEQKARSGEADPADD